MTTKQRNRCYKKALPILNNERNQFLFRGLCYATSKAGFGEGTYFDWERAIVAPELELFDPKDEFSYWCDMDEEGWKLRETILLFCIAMTEK